MISTPKGLEGVAKWLETGVYYYGSRRFYSEKDWQAAVEEVVDWGGDGTTIAHQYLVIEDYLNGIVPEQDPFIGVDFVDEVQ